MNGATPQRKVVAGGVAGALSAIAVWACEQFGGIKIPADIALSVYTVLLFGIQYLLPNAGDSK